MPATEPSSLSSDDPATTPPGNANLRAALRANGLRLGTSNGLTIRRRGCGRGFVYLDERGRRIVDPAVLKRIRSLAIPPAYREVRIARDARAHIQAVGCDMAGRIQYRYHPHWENVREDQKVERLATLCAALPRLRRRIRRDLQGSGLGRDRVTAAVIRLIDSTHIRVGCEGYVRTGRSRGAATLLKRSLSRDGATLDLTFRGKGGRTTRCEVADPLLARVTQDLQALRGARLFQYVDGRGRIRPVTSVDVNAYLREIARAPVSAKDFRSLAATAAAGRWLARTAPATSERGRRRQIAEVMQVVSELLGNTPAVARRSYVHRRMIRAFEDGRLPALFAKHRRTGLSGAEAVVAAVVAEAADP